ncbi:MAG: hypothetical protein RBR68_14260 [Tenuifilaceae bacterium]|nr:hypothetical protein [Tenuifilaceae bacterium]
MIYSTDFKANNADDIIIHDDILIEEDPRISILNNAERRISSRYDDFVLDSISAGIERYLLKKTQFTHSDIKYTIRNVLEVNELLIDNDFDIIIDEDKVNVNILHIYLKLNKSISTSPFRITINLQNQRSFR